MKSPTYIIYYCRSEFLIMTPENEKVMLTEYFNKGGRDMEEYDREEIFDDIVTIRPTAKLG